MSLPSSSCLCFFFVTARHDHPLPFCTPLTTIQPSKTSRQAVKDPVLNAGKDSCVCCFHFCVVLGGFVVYCCGSLSSSTSRTRRPHHRRPRQHFVGHCLFMCVRFYLLCSFVVFVAYCCGL